MLGAMDALVAGGMITVIGSILYIFAAAPMSRIYGGRDADAVVAEIQAHWRAYVVSQTMFGAGSVVTGVGTALMAVRFAEASGPLLPVVGALSMLGGGVLWALISYDRTLDFERFFREYGSFGWRAVAWLALTGIGLAIYGFIFLDAGFPEWVAYGTWVLVGLQVGGAIVAPKLVPPQIYYLATLLIGAVAVVTPFPGTAA